MAALAVVILAPLPLSHAAESEREPVHALDVLLVDMPGVATIVSWTPAPLADRYLVYRGPSLDALTLVATTDVTSFVDDAVPVDDTAVWYLILGKAPTNSVMPDTPDRKGQCVSQRDHRTSVTASNCTPQSG